LLIQGGERRTPDALPHPFLAPLFESAPHSRRRTILARQILPATARDKHIEDAFESLAVVSAGPPRASGRWQERLDEGPLILSEMNPAHAGMLCHLKDVLEPPLG
jgi:hypothetical protein